MYKRQHEVVEAERLTADQIKAIAQYIEDSCKDANHALNVEDIQDLVEDQLMAVSYTHLDVYKRQRKECVNNAMKIYCRSIFDALNEGDISLIKFYKDEL